MTKIDVKNLKINKKLATGIGGIVLVGGLVGVALFSKNNKPVIDSAYTFEEMLEKNKDNTSLDEILELNKTMFSEIFNKNVSNDNYSMNDKMNLITKLEFGFELHRYIESVEFLHNKEFNTLSDNDLTEVFYNISNDNIKEYVAELITVINDKNTNDVTKARSAQKLYYINDYYERFILKNGVIITKDLLKEVLNSCACDVSGLEPMFVDENCGFYFYSMGVKKHIILTDPVSGISFTYYIDNKSGIIKDIANELKKMQYLSGENDDLSFEGVEKVCIPALNNIKKLLDNDVQLNDSVLTVTTRNEVKTKTK